VPFAWRSSTSARMAALRSPVHGTSWRCAPNSRLRNALPEVLYSGVGGSSRPW
jgi:hypothetical protein